MENQPQSDHLAESVNTGERKSTLHDDLSATHQDNEGTSTPKIVYPTILVRCVIVFSLMLATFLVDHF
jgi:hypothetical protein